MRTQVLSFFRLAVQSLSSAGKLDLSMSRVLEVGSYDVNGSVRGAFTGCREYIGIDTVEGPGVDIILNGADAPSRFDPGSFDIVVSSDALEHCSDWMSVLSAMQEVCRVGGVVLLSAAAPGFPRHNEPDYWRFTPATIARKFDEWFCSHLSQVEGSPGVMGCFVKPKPGQECNREYDGIPNA